MNNLKSREKNINSYLVSVQSILAFIILLLIGKYHYNVPHFFTVGCVLICSLHLSLNFLLTSIIIKVRHNTKKFYWLGLAIVLSNVSLITYFIISTNTAKLDILFLIPVLIASIKFPLVYSIPLTLAIGIFNGLITYYVLSPITLRNSMEQDLILLGVFVMVSWLVGSVLKVEKEIRDNLYRTQASLLENKGLLEKIVNYMPLGIIVVDQGERIVHINQEALDINGIKDKSPQDFGGTPYSDYFYQRLEPLPLSESYIYQIFHTGQSFYKEKRIRNGKLLENTGTAIYDEEDKLTHAMVVFQDISQEELTREKLQQFERINLVGQMAASIAHEIKNPLTTIRGFLQLATRNKDHLTIDNLKLLINEIDRCNDIISDFLSITRKVDHGKELANLKEIIEAQGILIGKDALFNGVELQLYLEEVPDLMLDKNEIKQLILNLCRNAVESMDQGGILKVRLKNQGAKILFEVEDTGIGIPQEIQDKLGTPFVTTKEAGTGLGFTVCTRVAENHQATINVASKKGQGTKVTVTFPRNILK